MTANKINVSRPVAQLEQVLREFESPARCEEVIAILRCWQDDETLDEPSRDKARLLVREFQPLRLARGLRLAPSAA